MVCELLKDTRKLRLLSFAGACGILVDSHTADRVCVLGEGGGLFADSIWIPFISLHVLCLSPVHVPPSSQPCTPLYSTLLYSTLLYSTLLWCAVLFFHLISSHLISFSSHFICSNFVSLFAGPVDAASMAILCGFLLSASGGLASSAHRHASATQTTSSNAHCLVRQH